MPDRVGQQLGNYRLTQFLGQGTFAEVYLGQHIYLNTQAAIKILKGQITSQERQTFQKEAQMVAQLRHPNIVRILEFGIENNFPFLIMDYLPRTMRGDIRFGERTGVSRVVKYIKQVASALQYAHNQKVIHRDVKPENMLESYDSIQLSDFGLAVISHSTQSLTQQGLAGSPAYMAPEQIEGKPRPASDQYALGVVAYEWLTGVNPFTGTSLVEVAMKHTFAPPPPFNKDLHISPHVEQVVLRALAKDPQERFPTIQAFADALEEASNIPHFSVQRFQDMVKAPALGTLLLLYKGYAGLVYSVIWSPDGARLAVSVDDQASFGIQVLEAKSGQLLYTYRGHELLVVRMSWSSDGKYIVSGCYDSTVQVWEAESGRKVSTYTEHTNQVNGVSWSPDGAKIASGAIDSVHIWEVKSGHLLYRHDGHSEKAVNSISWSPNGTRIASSATDNTVQVLEAKSGRKLSTCTGHTDMVFSVSWSPDGAKIASGASDNTVQIWEAKSGRMLYTYRGHSMPVYGLAWSPDGTRLASGSLDETVQIWQAK